MSAFATPEEVAVALGADTPDGAAREQLELLLEQASAEIRAETRAWIAPRKTSTVTLLPTWDGTVRLPQTLVARIVDVQRAGQSIGYTWDTVTLKVAGSEPVTVTYEYGAVEVPQDVKRMAIALVAEALSLTEFRILQVGRIRTLAVDDFRVAFSDEGIGGGVTLPPIQAAKLRARYGPPTTAIIEVIPE